MRRIKDKEMSDKKITWRTFPQVFLSYSFWITCSISMIFTLTNFATGADTSEWTKFAGYFSLGVFSCLAMCFFVFKVKGRLEDRKRDKWLALMDTYSRRLDDLRDSAKWCLKHGDIEQFNLYVQESDRLLAEMNEKIEIRRGEKGVGRRAEEERTRDGKDIEGTHQRDQ